MKNLLNFLGASLLFFGVYALLALTSAYQCEQRWKEQGSYWGWPEGCMVNTPEGVYVPESNFRLMF